jgi:hypothetical protein
MRRFLIGLTLALLLAISIGIGIAVAQWPQWKQLLGATQAGKVAPLPAANAITSEKSPQAIFPMN